MSRDEPGRADSEAGSALCQVARSATVLLGGYGSLPGATVSGSRSPAVAATVAITTAAPARHGDRADDRRVRDRQPSAWVPRRRSVAAWRVSCSPVPSSIVDIACRFDASAISWSSAEPGRVRSPIDGRTSCRTCRMQLSRSTVCESCPVGGTGHPGLNVDSGRRVGQGPSALARAFTCARHAVHIRASPTVLGGIRLQTRCPAQLPRALRRGGDGLASTAAAPALAVQMAVPRSWLQRVCAGGAEGT